MTKKTLTSPKNGGKLPQEGSRRTFNLYAVGAISCGKEGNGKEEGAVLTLAEATDGVFEAKNDQMEVAANPDPEAFKEFKFQECYRGGGFEKKCHHCGYDGGLWWFFRGGYGTNEVAFILCPYCEKSIFCDIID
jgi:hypothetical protein